MSEQTTLYEKLTEAKLFPKVEAKPRGTRQQSVTADERRDY